MQVDFHLGLGLDPCCFLEHRHGLAQRHDPSASRTGQGPPEGVAAAAGGLGGGRRVTYGRTVVIECDGRPAAEVLEVVVP